MPRNNQSSHWQHDEHITRARPTEAELVRKLKDIDLANEVGGKAETMDSFHGLMDFLTRGFQSGDEAKVNDLMSMICS